jgi:hypothetical protein
LGSVGCTVSCGVGCEGPCGVSCGVPGEVGDVGCSNSITVKRPQMAIAQTTARRDFIALTFRLLLILLWQLDGFRLNVLRSAEKSSQIFPKMTPSVHIFQNEKKEKGNLWIYVVYFFLKMPSKASTIAIATATSMP